MQPQCSTCSARILLATQTKYDGLCVPCFRARLNPFNGERQYGTIVHYMDASALIKYFEDEEGSNRLRKHIYACVESRKSVVFRTTHLCFGETLGYFKTKRRRKRISHEQYVDISFQVLRSISSIFVIEQPLLNVLPEIQIRVIELTKKHGLDVADAFLITAAEWVKTEYVNLIGGLEAILVSADSDLVNSARAEGVRAWDIISDVAP